MQDYFKIGEISKLYGIGVDSLRYYERIGILNPERSESGYRHYSLRDIWKLNTIRDLRGLGFGMEQIRDYLSSHTVDSTLALLEQEQQAIREKIRELRMLQDNVACRMDTIRSARQRPLDTITLEYCPARRCFAIPEGYSDDREMDVLIRRLTNLDKQHLYVIGSNQIGTVIPLDGGELRYQAVFVVDSQGDYSLPAGNYLTLTYRGDYSRTRDWVPKILKYAGDRGIRLLGDMLEILWIDIHTTGQKDEYITELQVLTDQDLRLSKTP